MGKYNAGLVFASTVNAATANLLLKCFKSNGYFNGTYIGNGSSIIALNGSSTSGIVPSTRGGTGVSNRILLMVQMILQSQLLEQQILLFH